jgi:hypothetical protein
MRSHSVVYAHQAALPDWLAVLQHELGSKSFVSLRNKYRQRYEEAKK